MRKGIVASMITLDGVNFANFRRNGEVKTGSL